MKTPIPVSVLGATGSVGQRFVQLLADHPWFDLQVVTGSEHRVGKEYRETCRWVLPEAMPEKIARLKMSPTDPENAGTPLVFSALPSGVAREIEPLFASAGAAVCTNAGAYRRERDVPILLPEVNADHIALIDRQRRERNWSGFIVTNPNCTSTGATVALKALQTAFGVRRVMLFSMQAISGAGYPGVPSLDILDNVIPFISGEEEKVAWEPRKMLGRIENEEIELAEIVFSTHTNRVAVSDGHLVCLSLELDRKPPLDEIAECLASYRPAAVVEQLPSCPRPVLQVRAEEDRPQPRLDRMTGQGMTTVVGRLRTDAILDYRMVVLSHNTIRGAAGGSILNAELLMEEGYLGSD